MESEKGEKCVQRSLGFVPYGNPAMKPPRNKCGSPSLRGGSKSRRVRPRDEHAGQETLWQRRLLQLQHHERSCVQRHREARRPVEREHFPQSQPQRSRQGERRERKQEKRWVKVEEHHHHHHQHHQNHEGRTPVELRDPELDDRDREDAVRRKEPAGDVGKGTDGPVAGSGDTDGVTASSASRVPDLGSGKGSSVPGVRPGRPAVANAARERSRVKTLRQAFQELQRTLPAVPPDTKLSKLDVLLLASTYIAHLTRTLRGDGDRAGSLRQRASYLHPVKKWPMRSRLYVGASGSFLGNAVVKGTESPQAEPPVSIP